jgi:hypothetical protein
MAFKSRAIAKGLALAAGIGFSLAFLLPAQAQFWDWGRPQRYQRSDPFRDFFGGGGAPRFEPRERNWNRDYEAPADSSHAPGPAAKKPEATTSVVVLGDANADWLAYGLEDAFSEKPEIGIVRKHRTDSGLIRYDPRRDIEWAGRARDHRGREAEIHHHDDRQQRPPIHPGKSAASGPAPRCPQPRWGRKA